MEPINPELLAQRFAGDAALQQLHPATLQALTAQLNNSRASAFHPVPPPQQQYREAQPVALFSQLLGNPATFAQLHGAQEVLEADPKPARSRGRAASGGQGNANAASVSYASRHQQAEARRRSRINERLEALRRVVPHSERANTATFLEEVLKYVERLQCRVAELEGRLGLEPTVKCDPVPRFGDAAAASAAAAPEPSTLTGGASDKSFLEQQQQQQSRPGTRSGRGGTVEQQQQLRGGGGAGPLAAAATAAAAAAAHPLSPDAHDFRGALPSPADLAAAAAAAGGLLGQFGGGNDGGSGRPLRSTAAGGDDLPSVSEELELGAALTAPPRAGSAAAAAAMMAESAPPGVGRPPGAGALTALAHLAASRQPPLGRGSPPGPAARRSDHFGPQPNGGATSPTNTSLLLQQAAHALLGGSGGHAFPPQPTASGGGSQGGAGAPDPRALQGMLLGAAGAHPRDQLPPGFPGGLHVGLGSAPRDASAQLHYHLLAAQQAAQRVAQLSLPPAQQGPPPQPFDLGAALLPLSASMGFSSGGGSGPQLPAFSAPARATAPPNPGAPMAAAALAAAAAGRELSNSGRSQQTQHPAGGYAPPPGDAAPARQEAGDGGGDKGMRAVAGGGLEQLPQREAKRRKLPERPTSSV